MSIGDITCCICLLLIICLAHTHTHIYTQVIIRKDWMFKLVGTEEFEIKGQDGSVFAKCEVLINACAGFTYEYILYVNGKQFKTFREKQSKIMHSWHFQLNDKEWRIILGNYNMTGFFFNFVLFERFLFL